MKSLIVRNERVELVFTPDGSLEAMTDLTNCRSIRFSGGTRSLWRLALRDASGNIRRIEADKLKLARAEGAGSRQLVMKWDAAPDGVQVTATVTLDESAIAQWDLAVRNRSGLSLWEVQYPIVGGVSRLAGDGEDDRFLTPWNTGVEFVNPVAFVTRGSVSKIDWISEFAQCDTEEGVHKLAFSYPGMWAHQFVALYHPESIGLYFGAHDGAARFKRFGLYQDSPDTVALVMVNYPDERMAPNLDYTMPYPVKAGCFTGSWHQAARIYREWAIHQKWCRKGKIKDRQDLPHWLVENDFWHWNWCSHMKDHFNAMPELYAPALVALKQRLDCNLAVHWYGSHCQPFNTANPELFPITETVRRKLKKGLALLHQHDIRAIPYMNPRLCDPETVTWEKYGVEQMACRTEMGKIHEEIYIEGKAWVTICPAQKQWHEIIFDIIRECMELGYDGVYVDQISSCFVVPCFAGHHGHPRGGGNTWYQGNLDMMETIQRRLKTPESCFTSEGTIECYNDIFEANLARTVTRMEYDTLGNKRSWPVPLSSCIYHDYALTYGSTTLLATDPPDTVYLGGALNLVSGNQLCFEGYTLTDIKRGKYRDYLAWYHTLCQFRKKYRTYFNAGEWVAPPEIDARQVALNLSVQRPAYPVPAVLAGAWKLDGAQLVYFVNHTAEPQTIAVRIDDRQEQITIPARAVVGREIGPVRPG